MTLLNSSAINDQTSDGYHTFDERYEHRNLLFINLCRMWIDEHSCGAWWNRNGDYEGYFCLYFEPHYRRGQISYYLPDKYLGSMAPIPGERCEIPYQEREWDGHTSKDVLDRLWENVK